MSGEAWAAVLLVVFVLLFLAGLLWLLRSHMEDQKLEDGRRAYGRAEGNPWYHDEDRLRYLREQAKNRRRGEEEDDPPPRRPRKSVYGKRVTGGDDGAE